MSVHYLQRELYADIQIDPQIFGFRQNVALDGFVSTMSHGVRMPLTAILRFFHRLTAFDIFDHQQQWAEEGRNSAETLLGALNQVPDASRLDAELVTPRAKAASLQEISRQILAVLLGGNAKSGKPLKRSVTCCEKPPERITVDRLRFTPISKNLVDNAIEFMTGSLIPVSIDCDPEAPIAVPIRVPDTGTGIAGADQERNFNAFKQVHDSVTREFGGSDLAVSISRDLAKRRSRDLTVSCASGFGSGFVLRLTGHAAREGART